jgi:protein-L-isoaspartate(D-aspartate) O-methyltransferase
MVEEQLRPHGVTDERVLQAMASIPREEFVPAKLRRAAYESNALAIGYGQTISQPIVVALITQALVPGENDVALEVGTGSGYQAAILGRLCRRVITIEREPALAEQASATLRRLGFDNVLVTIADGSLGWPPEAPFDAIAVSCASPTLPDSLVEQLAPEGRLVIPLGSSTDDHQDLRLYQRDDNGLRYRSLFPVRFVPLTSG